MFFFTFFSVALKFFFVKLVYESANEFIGWNSLFVLLILVVVIQQVIPNPKSKIQNLKSYWEGWASLRFSPTKLPNPVLFLDIVTDITGVG
ncbi:MAG: hypothetical protein AN484_18875 [Aphanizomenon flos-aquae WA102]|uniref:Uncharacterized protein n=1 Tax=Aphanizomenon flos-aquae WA102 TaxID=1710896 RepID=A0A1B7WYP7_APHFL|nr:MAG: hypothetical protein AN484_18875 [Aphanizomenon flos-aquae WA102]